jgi:hypothetical protein
VGDIESLYDSHVWNFLRGGYINTLAFAAFLIGFPPPPPPPFLIIIIKTLGVTDEFYSGEIKRLLICVQWGD